jgi:adenine-specific DNA-methyltransferase
MNDNHQKTEAKTESLSIKKLEEFKQLFPGVISDGVLDAGRLGELLQTDVSGLKGGKERFGLMWAGRQKAIEALQAESYAALIPDFENSINWDSAQNVFIEGDNLEVLKLLQNAYNDKIKMIYIDPPYNTGNDFVYKDDFSDPKQHYLEVTGQVDAEGNRLTSNTETSGRKHSNWLTMMYPRLVLARNLLTEDGALLISIGSDEVENLTIILKEIFGEENHIASFIWKSKSGGANDSKHVVKDHEYLIAMARDLSTLSSGELSYGDKNLDLYAWQDDHVADRGPYRRMLLDQKGLTYSKSLTYAIQTPDGTEIIPDVQSRAIWRWSSETLARRLADGFVEFVKNDSGIWRCYTKQYLKVDYDGNPVTRGSLIRTVIETVDGRAGTREVAEFMGAKVFSNPKPTELLKLFVNILAPKGDEIVLDFFAGSGSLGHAVEIQNLSDAGNRKYICVTLKEETPPNSVAYSEGFKFISEITEARLRKASSISEGAMARGLRVLRLGASLFKPHFSSDESLFVLDETSLEKGSTPDYVAGEVLLRQGVTLDQPWKRALGIQSGSVGFFDLTDPIEVDQILGTEAKVFVFLEDSLKGRDALKSELSFAIAQAGKKMVTY